MNDTWVCIAARNEAATIGNLVRRLRRWGFQVAVTDDASEDETGIHAAAAGAQVAQHAERQGIAASVMDAWHVALNGGAERIIQMDAGGSHRPGDALRLRAIEADVVIGSRFLPESEYTGRRWRAAMSRLAAIACSAKAGRWLTDWTSGFRAFRADTAYYLTTFCDYEAQMHGWQIEILGKALRAGLNVAEAPISYAAGESSFNWQVAGEAFSVWRRL